MKKTRRVLLITLMIGAAIVCLIAVCERPGFSPPGGLVWERKFGDYQLKIYRQDEETRFERLCNRLPSSLASFGRRLAGDSPWAGFEILKSGRRIYADYGANFRIAELEDGGEGVGFDINGTGTPKIVVCDSFGRLGGGVFSIFECADQFRLLAVVESVGLFPEFKDLDHDGIPEIIVSDDAFYHWPNVRDGNFMPEVILRWRNDKYVAAKELMRQPAPELEELWALAAQIRASPEWDPVSDSAPEALWTNAVALMYSGHEDLGWKFVEAAWKPGFSGNDQNKEVMIDYYLHGKLSESLYWQDLKSVNPMPSKAGDGTHSIGN